MKRFLVIEQESREKKEKLILQRSSHEDVLEEDCEFVFFWKISDANGWLSNWSNHSFKDHDGNHFATAEHYLMFEKAKLMKDSQAMQKVLLAKSPEEAKKLGRSVKNWDESAWVNNREKIMLRGLELKLAAHPELQQLLSSTAGKVIAEASPYDVIWGIGLARSHQHVTKPKLWRGENLLGKMWMRLRECTMPVTNACSSN